MDRDGECKMGVKFKLQGIKEIISVTYRLLFSSHQHGKKRYEFNSESRYTE